MTEPVCKTGNLILDVLTAEHLSKLSSDVDVEINGTIRDIGDIDPVHLCVIYGNLLSNAIEAIKKDASSDRFLSITFRQGRINLEIVVENSCDGQTIQRDGSILITHKNDLRNHGFGLQNIRDCVNRNHGTFSFDHTDSLFTARITLPISA